MAALPPAPSARPQPAAASENVIAADTNIVGPVTCGSSLQLAGVVEGDVNVGSTLVVLEGAEIRGDVSASDITVHGLVRGAISASGRLRIAATGRVVGDIGVESLLVEDGGALEGRCDMGAPPLSRLRAVSEAEEDASSIFDEDDGPVLALSVQPA